MFTVPSESSILQFRTRACQNRIIKEGIPFLPPSCHFSHKTRHCGSQISVVNDLSTFARRDPAPRTGTPSVYNEPFRSTVGKLMSVN